MGFDGKQAIHPDQIPVIYANFTPPAPSIAFAKKIVEESRRHFAQGVGAFEIDGKMIDAPMIKVLHHRKKEQPTKNKKQKTKTKTCTAAWGD